MTNYSFCTKIIILFSLISETLLSDVIVNEVQPAPIGNEPEWLEIYNPTDEDFELRDTYINDATNSLVRIPDFNIKSKKYAVLTKDSTALKQRRSIPWDCKIINISKLPTFNNTTDLIVIRRSDSTIIDSVYYDIKWGKTGISLERKDWSKPAISNENWSASCSPDSATAGYENCNAVKDYSATVSLSRDKDLNLNFNIINTGRKPLSGINYDAYSDINNDGQFSNSERISEGVVLTIPKDNDLQLSILYNDLEKILPRKGKFKSVYYLTMNSRKDTLFKLFFDFYISYTFNSVKFNEIMFDVSKENSEYLEFYNSTDDSINLYGWFIANKQNRAKSDTFRITNDILVEPKGYFLIAFDTLIYNKFPYLLANKNVVAKKSGYNLLAAGDKLIIADPNGMIIDSVNYEPAMHLPSLPIKKDVSLEKINVNLISYDIKSWTSSRDELGGTPSRPNSIFESVNSEGFLSANPNPFSPFSQGSDSKTEILFELPFNDALINIKIFDASGYFVFEPVNNRVSSSVGSVVWDGRAKNENFLPPGQYIVVLQASEVQTNKIWEGKIVVVIGK